MFPPSGLPDHLILQPHPTARDKAVSTSCLPAGKVIFSVPSFTTLLLPNEKGRRCDFCHSLAAPQDRGLRRCTGCALYWYCDSKCQTLHWRTHKKYCKNINAFCASHSFNQLESHEKLDALLLTHLLAECSARGTVTREGDDPDLVLFMSLLPGPVKGKVAPPTCRLSAGHRPSVQLANELFSRCGNNNFSIHSHLTTIAHGVFPLSSRLFNHSCVPNAVAKYRIAVANAVVMDIVAIRDIPPGEEMCIPYLDPALIETRQQMFRFTYGFSCTCSSCTVFKTLARDASRPIPDKEELKSLGTSLCEFVFPDLHPDAIRLPSSPVNLESVPFEVLRIFRESCLTSLCESFSAFSHDGPFESALDVGLTILAFYVVIYPPNFPQIGMHLLEMAKTAWNAFITMEDTGRSSGSKLLAQVGAYLRLSNQVLAVIGQEGDEGGPIADIQVLERLLREQG